jgi:hypothetical protein
MRFGQRLRDSSRVGRQHDTKVIDGGCPRTFGPAAYAGRTVMRIVPTVTGDPPKKVA